MRSQVRRRVAAVIGVVAIVAGTGLAASQATAAPKSTTPCPGASAAPVLTNTTYFTDPRVSSYAKRDRITQAMTHLICAVTPTAANATKHSTIDLAMYKFDLATGVDGETDDGAINNLAHALLWAQNDAHAVIHVVVDGGVPTLQGTGTNVLYQTLTDPTSGLTAPSVVVACSHGTEDTSCAANRIMHTKLLLVSSVGPKRASAVFVSSQNLTAANAYDAYNNAIQLVGNAKVYADYAKYFSALMPDVQEPNLGHRLAATTAPKEGSVRARPYFFPRNDPSFPDTITSGQDVGFPKDPGTDTIAQDQPVDSVASVLNDVTTCTNPGKAPAYEKVGTALDGQPKGRTLVQIAMYTFHDRPAINAAISSLVQAGCDVQLVYSESNKPTFAIMQSWLGPNFSMYESFAPNVPGPDSPTTGRCLYLHSKYLLISGGYAGQKNRNVVLTGSENWTAEALHDNDETMVQLQETSPSPLFNAYEREFSNIDRAASISSPAVADVHGCLAITRAPQ